MSDIYRIEVRNWYRNVVATYVDVNEARYAQIVKLEKARSNVAAIFASKNGGRIRKVYGAPVSKKPKK